MEAKERNEAVKEAMLLPLGLDSALILRLFKLVLKSSGRRWTTPTSSVSRRLSKLPSQSFLPCDSLLLFHFSLDCHGAHLEPRGVLRALGGPEGLDKPPGRRGVAAALEPQQHAGALCHELPCHAVKVKA